MKNNLEQLGFNRNHYLIGLTALIVFAILVFPRTGIKLSAMFSQAEEPKPQITYEQMRGEVYAQMGVGEVDPYIEELDKQFALLDRGQADGSVLGDAIGIGEVPNADELVLPEVEQRFPVRVTAGFQPEQETKYMAQLQELETSYGTLTMAADLNSSDLNLLQASVKKWQSLLTDLSNSEVPPTLEDYHRTKIYYYYSMMKIGNVYAGLEDESALGTYLKVMISFGNKLNQYESVQ